MQYHTYWIVAVDRFMTIVSVRAAQMIFPSLITVMVLLWCASIIYTSFAVCACECVYVRVSVCVRVCLCECVCVCVSANG